MAENSGQERTEKGTGKRRSEARKRGQVVISREIPSTLILFDALGVFHFAGAQVFEQWSLVRVVVGIFAPSEFHHRRQRPRGRSFADDSDAGSVLRAVPGGRLRR